jgi:hypothetical protein
MQHHAQWILAAREHARKLAGKKCDATIATF